MTRRSGFTLLESIVALAIVSIVCIGVLAAQGAALRAETTAASRLPLAALAEERVAAIDLYAGPLAALPDSVAFGSFAAPYDQAHWTTSAQRIAGSNTLWDVTISVEEGTARFTLHTRRYRPANP